MTLRKSQRLGLIGLDKHQTIQLDAGLITGSDLIIVVDKINQREALGSEFPLPAFEKDVSAVRIFGW